METNTKIQLSAGMFILLVLTGGTTYFLAEGDTAYHCEDTNTIGICWKLSAVNDYGLQRNCYYNESSPRKYKTCSSGWLEYSGELIGDPISLPDFIEIIISEDKKEILNKNNITNPYLTECKDYNPFDKEYFCYSKLLQEKPVRINKDLKVNYLTCNNSCYNETIDFIDYIFENITIENNETNESYEIEISVPFNSTKEITICGECLEWNDPLTELEIIENLKGQAQSFLNLTAYNIELKDFYENNSEQYSTKMEIKIE